MSGCHATTHTDLSLSLSVSLSRAHTHTRTHTYAHIHTQAVGNTLYCRIINRRYQKAAPLSSSSMPMGPYHSHLPFHPSILSTRPLSSLEPHRCSIFFVKVYTSPLQPNMHLFRLLQTSTAFLLTWDAQQFFFSWNKRALFSNL